jgi:hypothetical protein
MAARVVRLNTPCRSFISPVLAQGLQPDTADRRSKVSLRWIDVRFKLIPVWYELNDFSKALESALIKEVTL